MRTLKFFIVLLFFTNAYAEEGDSLNPETPVVPSLSILNLKHVLIAEGVQYPDIVLRQAITETGWFKCENCSLSRNNIFGFYYKKKYLSFDSWVECVKYYKRWQDRHYKGGDYYAFLKKVGFATNPRYVKDLKSLKLD